MAERPKFQLIKTEEWVASPAWLKLPQMIYARSPEDRGTFIRVRVARHDVIKAAEAKRRQPAFDFWSVLNAKAPPVPNEEADPDAGLISLGDAHACFNGVKRPIASDDDGDRMLAYVLKPTSHYVYEPRPPVLLSTKRPVPSDLVFVAYVRLDEPVGSGTIGQLTHWHFVEANPSDPNLPIEYETRYRQRLW